MRRLLRSPVAQFLVVGTIVLVAVAFGTNDRAGRAASSEAIDEATRTAQVLSISITEPYIPRGLAAGEQGAIDKFDRAVITRRIGNGVQHLDILNSQGTIVYSDRFELIQRQVDLSADQRRVLGHGGSGSRMADPANESDGAGQFSSDTSGLVQIYTKMRSPEGRPLLFAAYFSLEQIDTRQAEIFGSFRWIILGPFLVLVALVTVMLRVLTGRLRSAAHERERLLRSAIDASDAERRRIARDLHDGVVQDLAGTAFSVVALARDPDTPERSRTTLVGAGVALRGSLKALRSLVAEIHPPDLATGGLRAALEDLIAPAGLAGIQASVSVEGDESAAPDTVALVWRVAQEVVRNATRHSGASTLAVTVRGEGDRITLEVVDDGVGFDPAAPRHRESYGLRGLATLVADFGGRLRVLSSPGEGTTVRMEVHAA